MHVIISQYQQWYNSIYEAFFPHVSSQVIIPAALQHSYYCHYPHFRGGTRALRLSNCPEVRQLESRNHWQLQASL